VIKVPASSNRKCNVTCDLLVSCSFSMFLDNSEFQQHIDSETDQ